MCALCLLIMMNRKTTTMMTMMMIMVMIMMIMVMVIYDIRRGKARDWPGSGDEPMIEKKYGSPHLKKVTGKTSGKMGKTL